VTRFQRDTVARILGDLLDEHDHPSGLNRRASMSTRRRSWWKSHRRRRWLI
jgi:hypothetical protein